ncbi:MAG: hypothetical protein GX287_05195 [Fusobacteria bacterium]|nr:hypothetical protein [Fusobacteriota bacterium]
MSHDGCSGSFDNGKKVIEKLRAMGFSNQYLPVPIEFKCENCGNEITMITFEYKCEHCGNLYGVTPCHAFDRDAIQSAGIEE